MSIPPVIGAAISRASGSGAVAGVPAVPKPSAETMDRFRSAMNGGVAQPGAGASDHAETTPVKPGNEVLCPAAGKTSPRPSLGDRILSYMHSTTAGIGGASGDLDSPRALIDMQMKVAQANLNLDMTGKVANKVSQDFNMLLNLK